jgi:hypothetical protein
MPAAQDHMLNADKELEKPQHCCCKLIIGDSSALYCRDAVKF